MSEFRRKSTKAFLWDFGGNIGMQFIAFIISIVLTRLLEPEQFGLLGMVMVFAAVAQVFMDMGFGSALIQKQNVNPTAYSTVFWFNLVIGSLISCGVFLLAPLIAVFYNEPELEGITKLLSTVFFISSIGNIQRIMYTIKLDFKTQSIISLFTAIISGATAIYMAFNGFGVHALVFQKIIAAVLTVLSFWYLSPWRPSFVFKVEDIKSIWGYSSKEFLDRIISTVYSKLDVLVIGKMFTPAILGFYTRAFSLNSMVGKLTSTSLNKVFFPLISSIQQDKERVRAVYLKIISLVGFLAIGISALLFVIANDLFVILFTEKWNQSIIYFKILVITGFTAPLSSIMLSLISGLGRPGMVLKSGIYKKGLGLVPIVVGIFNGIEAFLYARIFFGLIGFYINLVCVKKVTSISVLEQVNCFIKTIIVGILISALLVNFSSIESRIVSLIFNTSIFVLLFSIVVLLVDRKLRNILSSEMKRIKITNK